MRGEDYGPPPPGMERPEHPDFEMLREIVVETFEPRLREAEDPNAEFEALLAEYLDGKSAAYLALQRATRAFGTSSPAEVMARMDDLYRGSSLYMEGMMAGIEFERRRARGGE